MVLNCTAKFQAHGQSVEKRNLFSDPAHGYVCSLAMAEPGNSYRTHED